MLIQAGVDNIKQKIASIEHRNHDRNLDRLAGLFGDRLLIKGLGDGGSDEGFHPLIGLIPGEILRGRQS